MALYQKAKRICNSGGGKTLLGAWRVARGAMCDEAPAGRQWPRRTSIVNLSAASAQPSPSPVGLDSPTSNRRLGCADRLKSELLGATRRRPACACPSLTCETLSREGSDSSLVEDALAAPEQNQWGQQKKDENHQLCHEKVAPAGPERGRKRHQVHDVRARSVSTEKRHRLPAPTGFLPTKSILRTWAALSRGVRSLEVTRH